MIPPTGWSRLAWDTWCDGNTYELECEDVGHQIALMTEFGKQARKRGVTPITRQITTTVGPKMGSPSVTRTYQLMVKAEFFTGKTGRTWPSRSAYLRAQTELAAEKDLENRP